MSRFAPVFCLLVTLTACWGCNSDSTTGTAITAETNDDSAPSVDEPQATTPVATAVAQQVNGRSKDGSAIEISFDDIDLPMQEDMVFRPFMLTDRARELDGKKVRISGYMLPDSKTKGIKQFVLLKNTECKFGPGGQADHLVNVLMVEGSDAKFREDPVSVEGTLIVKPFTGPDGNTWSIYDLACDGVRRYRPRR